MLKNKVLVRFNVVELDMIFDAFIPVNELIWKIKKMVSKSIGDLTNVSEFNSKEYCFFNKDNSIIYRNNDIVINTDIRNGTEIVVVSM